MRKRLFLCAVQYCRMGRRAVACGRCRKERCTAVCSVGGGMPGALVQGPFASCRMKRTHWNCGENCGLRTAVVCVVVLGAALLSMWLYSLALRRRCGCCCGECPLWFYDAGWDTCRPK